MVEHNAPLNEAGARGWSRMPALFGTCELFSLNESLQLESSSISTEELLNLAGRRSSRVDLTSNNIFIVVLNLDSLFFLLPSDLCVP